MKDTAAGDKSVRLTQYSIILYMKWLYLLQTVENDSTSDGLDVAIIEPAIARYQVQLPVASNLIYPRFEQWEELIRWIECACANLLAHTCMQQPELVSKVEVRSGTKHGLLGREREYVKYLVDPCMLKERGLFLIIFTWLKKMCGVFLFRLLLESCQSIATQYQEMQMCCWKLRSWQTWTAVSPLLM